jgi:signal transduction histidine kinase
MNDGQQTKIFDDFYTTREHGTGLGLSIVRRLVMDLDGTISLKSVPGRGTSFFLSFPANSAG